MVLEVAFVDDDVYEREALHGIDAGGDVTYETEWAAVQALRARPEPLYPDRLGGLVAGDAVHVVS